MPPEVLTEIDENIRVSQANSGMTLCLAINYSGRTEMVDAVQAIATQVKAGSLAPADIDETTISRAIRSGRAHQSTAVRLANAFRISMKDIQAQPNGKKHEA